MQSPHPPRCTHAHTRCMHTHHSPKCTHTQSTRGDPFHLVYLLSFVPRHFPRLIHIDAQGSAPFCCSSARAGHHCQQVLQSLRGFAEGRAAHSTWPGARLPLHRCFLSSKSKRLWGQTVEAVLSEPPGAAESGTSVLGHREVGCLRGGQTVGRGRRGVCEVSLPSHPFPTRRWRWCSPAGGSC